MNPPRSFGSRRLSIQPLEDRRLLAAGALEQEAVYLLNRARHDPAAYQAEHNLPVNLSQIQGRGPLAVNDALFSSAETKVDDLIANDYFSHISPSGVQANALARAAGYPLPDAFIDDGNFIESLSAGGSRDTAASAVNSLIVDEGLPSAPHRAQLLGATDFWAAHREIGVGFASSPNASFENYWALHTSPRDMVAQFLTGVVFDDLNNDGRYNAGEGLANVTILVDGLQTVTTNAAGGWSALVQTGDHHVQASGGSFVGVSTASTNVGTDNVAIDFISGEQRGYVGYTARYATNSQTLQDVNGIHDVTPFDALLILNYLSAGDRALTAVYDQPLYMDLDGNNQISPFDALLVINELSDRARASARTEQVLIVLPSVSFPGVSVVDYFSNPDEDEEIQRNPEVDPLT